MSDILEADREGELPHPRETLELHGHREAEAVLAQAYAQGRMPPAWLIGGPRGLGKATLAYRFARVLLAGGRIDPNRPLLSGAHDITTRLVSGQAHPDLMVLRRPYDEKAKRLKAQIPVEDVRRIHNLFGHRGGGTGYRVCIVDAADDLSTASANALLKTLEEPPERSVFLLVAHAPARLLPTIRSRCRRLILKPLTPAEMAPLLGARLAALSDADRHLLSVLAEGRPGRALTLAGADGLTLYRDLLRLLQALPRPDPGRVHDFAEKLARPQEEQAYRTTLELLSGFLDRLVRAGAGLASDLSDPVEEALRRRLNAAAGLERWAELWEKINGLAQRADALSLDRRHVVLTSVQALSSIAAGT